MLGFPRLRTEKRRGKTDFSDAVPDEAPAQVRDLLNFSKGLG
jgi:hypothetical protein